MPPEAMSLVVLKAQDPKRCRRVSLDCRDSRVVGDGGPEGGGEKSGGIPRHQIGVRQASRVGTRWTNAFAARHCAYCCRSYGAMQCLLFYCFSKLNSRGGAGRVRIVCPTHVPARRKGRRKHDEAGFEAKEQGTRNEKKKSGVGMSLMMRKKKRREKGGPLVAWERADDRGKASRKPDPCWLCPPRHQTWT